jgi:hypothetical protein
MLVACDPYIYFGTQHYTWSFDMIHNMIEVPVSVHERNVYAGRIWQALASAGHGKTLAQVTAPLPMDACRGCS